MNRYWSHPKRGSVQQPIPACHASADTVVCVSGETSRHGSMHAVFCPSHTEILPLTASKDESIVRNRQGDHEYHRNRIVANRVDGGVGGGEGVVGGEGAGRAQHGSSALATILQALESPFLRCTSISIISECIRSGETAWCTVSRKAIDRAVHECSEHKNDRNGGNHADRAAANIVYLCRTG